MLIRLTESRSTYFIFVMTPYCPSQKCRLPNSLFGTRSNEHRKKINESLVSRELLLRWSFVSTRDTYKNSRGTERSIAAAVRSRSNQCPDETGTARCVIYTHEIRYSGSFSVNLHSTAGDLGLSRVSEARFRVTARKYNTFIAGDAVILAA